MTMKPTTPACLVALSAALTVAGCNTRTPILDTSVLSTAPTAIAGPITGPRSPRILELAPAGTMGGRSGRATVFLSFPAPDGGLAVSLRSLHPSVAVQPTEVTVPGGSLSASFSYTTQAVGADTTAEIVASTADGSIVAKLGVWAPLPTFFSFSVDKGAMIGSSIADREIAERYTPANARFDVSCRNGSVSVIVVPLPPTGVGWFLDFGPPERIPNYLPFPPGVYTLPGSRMRVERNPATGCRIGGQFTLHEAHFARQDRLGSLWATFEQTCAGRPGATRGDLRLTDVPVTLSVSCPRFTP